jgi:hypothetical protein
MGDDAFDERARDRLLDADFDERDRLLDDAFDERERALDDAFDDELGNNWVLMLDNDKDLLEDVDDIYIYNLIREFLSKIWVV